ncbi:hypothetical protein BD413DRAFT_468426 [Trametes elegans]|nr:hypothetical protein BD413DRAFT_468426 [Trametes elegans]
MLRWTLRIPPQVPRLHVRHYVRKPHSPAPQPENPYSLLAAYRAHCAHPTLALVYALRTAPPSVHSPGVLTQADVRPEEYEQWQPAVRAQSLAAALDATKAILESKNPDTQALQSSPSSADLPLWTLLCLLCKQPASDTEASVVHRLAMSYPLSVSPEVTPLVLILSSYWLTTFHILAPLRSAVLRFCRSHEALQAYQVCLFLRVLAQAEPRAELQRMIAVVLRIAIRHKMVIDVRTYSAILANAANAPAASHVALLVESHMDRSGFTPNLSHAHAFVRIYGDNGRRKQAARFWHRIRHGEFYGKVPPYISTKSSQSRMLDDYLKAFRNTKKIDLYMRYLLKTTSRAHQPGEATQDDLRVAKPSLSKTNDLPPNVWLRVLLTASRDSKVPTDGLLALLQHGRAALTSSRKALLATFFVLKSLLRRHELHHVDPLLADVLQQKERFDAAQLTIAVEALTMLGRAYEAFRLLQEFNRLPPPIGAATPTPPAPSLIDTRTINSFMIALLRTGRPDVVFFLWDTMPRVFGREPDGATLAIVLKAARAARKCERTLQVALADFGLGRFLPRAAAGAEFERAPQRLDRAAAVEGLERLLGPRGRGTTAVTGFWRGERAGDVALRVAWQVLVGNWPALKELRSPVRAVRRRADDQALSPVADMLRSHSATEGVGFGFGEAEADEDGRTFYGVVPHDVAFRALIDLLAEEDRAGEVPRVLQWMKYMGVTPSKDTLATALVYWGEVALEGPLIERWRGPARSEYDRLVRWIGKWVGRGRVPGREEMQNALRRIRYFRERAELRARTRQERL